MKLVYQSFDGVTKILDMVEDEAYFQGDSMHDGYKVADDDDFDTGCECLQLHVLMSMYEGYECAGSYAGHEGFPGFSWAILPENQEEVEWIRANHIKRAMYREDYRLDDEGEEN